MSLTLNIYICIYENFKIENRRVCSKFESLHSKRCSVPPRRCTTLCGGLKYPNQFHRMTREKLRVISPGGISLLRLIQGLVVRMPIPHLVPRAWWGRGMSREDDEEEERQGREGKGRERRIQYEATPQRIKHPSVLILLVSYTEDRGDALIYETSAHMVATSGDGTAALWWQSFPSGKHQSAEMDRASRATEDRARQEVDFNRGKRKWVGHPHRKGSFWQCMKDWVLVSSTCSKINLSNWL